MRPAKTSFFLFGEMRTTASNIAITLAEIFFFAVINHVPFCNWNKK